MQQTFNFGGPQRAVKILVQPLARDDYRFTVRALMDGAVVDEEAAHIGDVVRRRNQMGAKWINRPEVARVEGGAIPWPFTLNRPEEEL